MIPERLDRWSALLHKLLKRAYRLLPFKKQLFSFVNHIYTPPKRIYRHLHFIGDFSVAADDKHRFIMRHYGYFLENEIFWTGLRGCYEKTSIQLWTRLCRQSRVILDVGANTGVYSLIAKSVNSGSSVVAFEPVNRVYKKLCANNALNKFDTVCLEVAASNKTGSATIYDTLDEHIYSVTVGKDLSSPGTTTIPVSIQTIRLDAFVDSNRVDNIDLIKIDVETHEAEVLQGMGEYLDKFRPTILIEILNDEVGRNVQQIVGGKGYLYFNIDDRTGSIRRVTNIAKSDLYNYLLCSDKTSRELGLS
ncbi:MAG: FkbM family methyltransferase [Burkholderiales bacterium]|nr:FkbM family methyltransferase [Burkholderiales bacterium]